VKQTSYTETYPGVIKAFHWHKKQWDVWFCCKGSIQAVLHDLRKDSKTKGETQVIFMGEENPVSVAIPPGVAHGYKVLGERTIGLFYHTSESYNPDKPDEERIPFDDPSIGFDWSTQNR
jgi:dTDP-4-dehydrorhamnose 3,5-epimerase